MCLYLYLYVYCKAPQALGRRVRYTRINYYYYYYYLPWCVAGVSDCPYFSRVELLGDRLARNLPAFQLHKVVKTPEEWQVTTPTLTRSHRQTHYLSLSLTHIHISSHTHRHTISLSHTHIDTLSLSHTHTTHAQTQTHTHRFITVNKMK